MPSELMPRGDPSRPRVRLVGLFAVLIAVNVLVWLVAWSIFHPYPKLMAMALLAYSFGLRHAVDADHIAAIDNVTRRLMQTGARPIGVGLFFSLGHSTVVILASLGLACSAMTLGSSFVAIKSVGSMVGTSVSAGFLFVIAIANILILLGVVRTLRRVKAGGRLVEEDLDSVLAERGLLTRLFRRLFDLVRTSWHMYPLGLLFGLGFDTATEIGVLGMSAVGAAQGMSIWSILIFPALFTAGMTLVDTADSAVMLGAYGWAFIKPIRKLYYNMTMTVISIVIALVVGGIEVLGLIGDTFGLDRGVWAYVASANDNLGTLGGLVIGIFVVGWALSALVYRLGGYDRIGATGA